MSGSEKDSTEKTIIQKPSLEEECQKRGFLDGTWFAPDFKRSVFTSVVAKCQLCLATRTKPIFISGAFNAKSNFKSHIESMHDVKLTEFEDYCSAKKELHAKSKKNSESRTRCYFSQDEMDENIINLILHTFLPFEIVENPQFRKLFDDLRIRQGGRTFRHLSARTVVRRIEDSVNQIIVSIKDEIARTHHVCTTADVWTSRTRRFMGMTVHWIDEHSLQRISYAIACRRFPGTHSHNRIADLLNNIHTSYGITEENLVGTITDNGSNFVKAFEVFGVDFEDSFYYEKSTAADEEDEESMRESIEAIPFDQIVSPLLPPRGLCASHTASLVLTTDLNKGIKSSENLELMYKDVLEKAQELWNLAKSPKKNEVIQETLGKALKRPVVTRWNSLFDCFEQLVQLKEKLLMLFTKLDIVDPLTVSNFRFIEEYVKCTRPVAEALDILQCEINIGYGYLLPTLISTRNKLSKLEKENLVYCKPLIPVLIASFEKRFSNIFNVVEEGKHAAVAAATHPKFKLRWLKCLDEKAQGNVISAINSAIASCCQPTSEPNPVSIRTDCDCFDFGSDDADESLSETLLSVNAGENDFRRFCKDKRNDLMILHGYSIVKSIFLKFNTLLPSSASVERLFSFATMFNVAKFNRLTHENFERRVLCKANGLSSTSREKPKIRERKQKANDNK